MMCEHSSSKVILDLDELSVLRCTSECGQILIELHLGNHMVKTITAAELILQQTMRAPGICSNGYDMTEQNHETR